MYYFLMFLTLRVFTIDHHLKFKEVCITITTVTPLSMFQNFVGKAVSNLIYKYFLVSYLLLIYINVEKFCYHFIIRYIRGNGAYSSFLSLYNITTNKKFRNNALSESFILSQLLLNKDVRIHLKKR